MGKDQSQQTSATSPETTMSSTLSETDRERERDKLRRKLQERLGRAREQEEKAIRDELQRLTSIASAKRMQLMARDECSIAA